MVPGWPTKGNKVTDCLVVVVVRADLADLLACKKETKLFTFLLHPLWIGVIPHTRTNETLFGRAANFGSNQKCCR